MSENKDKYHETVIDLEARAKKNEDVVLKMGNSLQGMFMLGLKPMSFYDSKLKHGLGYTNPYTLKKAISHNPNLYDASCLDDSETQMNVRDSEDILDDATKSQITMKRKSQDPIAIEKKQNVWTIDYKKLNTLYEKFVPQKDFSAEQKYFLSSFISSEDSSNASSPYSSSETKLTMTSIPSANSMLKALFTTPRTVKSQFEDTTPVVSKTRFSVKTVPAVSKTKIVVITPLSAKHNVSSAFKLRDNSLSNYMKKNSNKSNVAKVKCCLYVLPVAQIVLWIVDSGCSKHMTGDRSLLKKFIEKFMGTVCFRNNHFAAITAQIVLWIVDSGCSKHMTGDRSLQKKFIEKFMGTVRFRNNHFAAITGYGDYVQGNITLCHVYYVEGLWHNLFNVAQFHDGDLEVAFRSNTCYVRNLEGDVTPRDWLLFTPF
nr:integrase, catalytic region, zinc finger, CCHC-type, peptidase aspartic, catalytic [Tanacetum cinerariifolium]